MLLAIEESKREAEAAGIAINNEDTPAEAPAEATAGEAVTDAPPTEQPNADTQ